MPMWRCPYCGTPQAETSRCWVCHRSTTSCGTCRHFRRAVVAQLGYCGKDRAHAPLNGREIRECWERGSDSRHQEADEAPPTWPNEPAPPAGGDGVPGWGLWGPATGTPPAERPR